MKITRDSLRPTPPDDRDFSLGAITTLPPLSEIPDDFMLDGIEIKDQRGTDFCTQFAACGVSGLQEGVSLSPEWSFAKTKELAGDIDGYGEDLRTAVATHVKVGAVEAKDVPFSVRTKSSKFLRRIENYPPELEKKAFIHMKKSYVLPEGPYDAFDNIRASLWKYKKNGENRGVAMGCKFRWDSKDVILGEGDGNVGGGHAMYYGGARKIKGTQYLALVQSYGEDAGENGIHYMSRKDVNYFYEKYKAFMFIDLTPEEVRYMIDNGITDRDNWIIQLYKAIVTLLTAQLKLLKKKV